MDLYVSTGAGDEAAVGCGQQGEGLGGAQVSSSLLTWHLPAPAWPALCATAGVVAREVVMQAADWFVTDFQVLSEALPRHRVAMIGSGGGNGGCGDGAGAGAGRATVVVPVSVVVVGGKASRICIRHCAQQRVCLC